MVLDIYKFYKLLEVSVNLKIKILHMHEYLISDKKSKKTIKENIWKLEEKTTTIVIKQIKWFHIRDLANNFGMQHLKDSLIHKWNKFKSLKNKTGTYISI